MNLYKSLDCLFPCGANRTFGEVVSVDIRVFLDNVDLGEISMKRKAWYVDASVNAFHMHRSLVRDFMSLTRDSGLSQRQDRRAKRQIALAVLVAYLNNFEKGVQYHNFNLHINTPPFGSVSMWWDRFPEHESSEIVDAPETNLLVLIWRDVDRVHSEYLKRLYRGTTPSTVKNEETRPEWLTVPKTPR